MRSRVTLIVLLVGVVPGVAVSAPVCVAVPVVADRCPAWTSTFNSSPTGSSIDMGFAAASAPDGSKVYVVGQTWDEPRAAMDWATIAYDAASGAQRWRSVLETPDERWDYPRDLVVGLDGRTVYVVGTVDAAFYEDGDYGVAAYDAADGSLRWLATYDADDGGVELPNAVALAPDGRTLFVTGKSGPTFGYDAATVAVDATTGTLLWSARYNRQRRRQHRGRRRRRQPGRRARLRDRLERRRGHRLRLRHARLRLGRRALDLGEPPRRRQGRRLRLLRRRER